MALSKVLRKSDRQESMPNFDMQSQEGIKRSEPKKYSGAELYMLCITPRAQEPIAGALVRCGRKPFPKVFLLGTSPEDSFSLAMLAFEVNGSPLVIFAACLVHTVQRLFHLHSSLLNITIPGYVVLPSMMSLSSKPWLNTLLLPYLLSTLPVLLPYDLYLLPYSWRGPLDIDIQ